MYTLDQLRTMGSIISSVEKFLNGKIVRRVGNTINYYRLNEDGLWDNYDCKTVS